MTDRSRHVWEGWTVLDFIEALDPSVEMIMSGQSWKRPFRDRDELQRWCVDNQPYYKKPIPEVVGYFENKYGII